MKRVTFNKAEAVVKRIREIESLLNKNGFVKISRKDKDEVGIEFNAPSDTGKKILNLLREELANLLAELKEIKC